MFLFPLSSLFFSFLFLSSHLYYFFRFLPFSLFFSPFLFPSAAPFLPSSPSPARAHRLDLVEQEASSSSAAMGERGASGEARGRPGEGQGVQQGRTAGRGSGVGVDGGPPRGTHGREEQRLHAAATGGRSRGGAWLVRPIGRIRQAR